MIRNESSGPVFKGGATDLIDVVAVTSGPIRNESSTDIILTLHKKDGSSKMLEFSREEGLAILAKYPHR